MSEEQRELTQDLFELHQQRLSRIEELLNSSWSIRRSPFETGRFSVLDESGKVIVTGLTFSEAVSCAHGLMVKRRRQVN